jgi:hypothetical protein
MSPFAQPVPIRRFAGTPGTARTSAIIVIAT